MSHLNALKILHLQHMATNTSRKNICLTAFDSSWIWIDETRFFFINYLISTGIFMLHFEKIIKSLIH